MKKAYKDLTKNELLTVKAALEEEYKTMEAKGLNLNMARGKPGFSQLTLSMPMLDVINSSSDMRTVLGNDTRNYGDLDGIGECRQLMADMMSVKKENVVVFDIGCRVSDIGHRGRESLFDSLHLGKHGDVTVAVAISHRLNTCEATHNCLAG